MTLKGKDIISIFDLTPQDILNLFQGAERVRKTPREKLLEVARGKVMACLFFEPSTRTRMSFIYAMLRLGGGVADLGPLQATSVAKGETLADTVRMIDGYETDLIVLRHRLEGASKLAAEIAEAPVINGGDGSREHPTQALLDLYTMWRIFKRIDGLKVGILGDLRYGRTPSSLSFALSMFQGVKIYFIAPEILQVREELVKRIEGRVEYTKTDDLRAVLPELDVLYVTRIQKERFPDPEEYARVKGIYRVDRKLLTETGSQPIILHPLPRVDEISPDVDSFPNAKYFEQASNGVFVRAALIAEVLGLRF